MPTPSNLADFVLEECYSVLLTDVEANLVGAPVYLSMAVASMAESHVAVIIEKLEGSESPKRSGNWQCDVHIKVVTCLDDAVATGFASLRAVHKQRCGIVRDALMISGLDQVLNSTADNMTPAQGLTVMDYIFSDLIHRIEGRSWISEFVIHHNQVLPISLPR